MFGFSRNKNVTSSGQKLFTVKAVPLAGTQVAHDNKQYYCFATNAVQQFVYEATSAAEAAGKFLIENASVGKFFVTEVVETTILK